MKKRATVKNGEIAVTIDKQRRFEVERRVVESVLRVSFESKHHWELWAMIGADEQLQVLPPDNELSQLRDRFENGSLDEHPAWDSAGDEKVDLLRKLASFIRVTCAREPKRTKLRVTIEADAVKLGFIGTREGAAVVCMGEILEVWRKDAWRGRSKVTDIREFTAKLRNEFASADADEER